MATGLELMPHSTETTKALLNPEVQVRVFKNR